MTIPIELSLAIRPDLDSETLPQSVSDFLEGRPNLATLVFAFLLGVLLAVTSVVEGLDGATNVWSLGGSILAPLFNGGRLSAQAEAAGSEVIRGQKGFSLFAKTGATEILDAAEDAISQGKKMIRYGVTLKTKLHHQVG